MSGGHFEYACHRISQMAEDIQWEIDHNEDKNDYGYATDASPECLEKIQRAQRVIELAGKLAREIEWFYSGDHGEESLMEILDKLLPQIEKW